MRRPSRSSFHVRVANRRARSEWTDAPFFAVDREVLFLPLTVSHKLAAAFCTRATRQERVGGAVCFMNFRYALSLIPR
jgi:hypothetical protein